MLLGLPNRRILVVGISGIRRLTIITPSVKWSRVQEVMGTNDEYDADTSWQKPGGYR